MSDANKATVKTYYEALDNGDKDGIAAILSEDLSWDFVGMGVMNKEAIGGLAVGFKAAFPDMKHTLGDQVAEGDMVATPLVFTGTHKGELMGNPASGKSVTISGINIHEVKDGKLVKGQTVIDLMGLMEQIGAIPTPS